MTPFGVGSALKIPPPLGLCSIAIPVIRKSEAADALSERDWEDSACSFREGRSVKWARLFVQSGEAAQKCRQLITSS